MAKLLRGGIANTEELRLQPPLAETADELCAVARLLGAPGSAVHLGQGANERTLKALSVAGTWPVPASFTLRPTDCWPLRPKPWLMLAPSLR